MKNLCCAGFLLLLAPLAQAAVTAQDLQNDAKTPDSVLTQGMGYDLKRYSPLKQISRETVKRLVPVWNYSMADDRGQQGQPLVLDGVMYVTDHVSTVAINAKTGRQIWKNVIEYPPETTRNVCCGISNRGAAVYGDKIFRTTLDAQVIALDIKTGKELWRSKAAEWKDGYSMTMAPLVANGVVVTGISGAEYGIRGFLDGWDPETGKQIWRRYTVPGPGEKGHETWAQDGDAWKTGGGSTWLVGSYDPQLDLMYWGVGNPAPWSTKMRGKGDHLYTGSVIALRPKTGEIVWHLQLNTNDPYDYDSVNEMVLADLKIGAKPRKVILHADKNGFFYVIDRTNGELLRANPFVKKITWAERIDTKTGRPVDSAAGHKARTAGEPMELWPSMFGAKNWQPMSYHPGTGLVYANTLNIGWNYKPIVQKREDGVMWVGIDMAAGPILPKEPFGYLKAIDPLSGKSKWEVPYAIPNWSGTLATAGGLIFTGDQEGEFAAYDAQTGKKVWRFQTGSGIVSQPITWTMNGKQYVAVLSGSGALYANIAGDPRLVSVPKGGSVWAFALQ